MTPAAGLQNDRTPTSLTAQVTAIEQKVLERQALLRAHVSLLHGRIRHQLVPVILLSGAGVGFITGALITRQGKPICAGAASRPSDFIGLGRALFGVWRVALAVFPLLVAALGPKEGNES